MKAIIFILIFNFVINTNVAVTIFNEINSPKADMQQHDEDEILISDYNLISEKMYLIISHYKELNSLEEEPRFNAQTNLKIKFNHNEMSELISDLNKNYENFNFSFLSNDYQKLLTAIEGLFFEYQMSFSYYKKFEGDEDIFISEKLHSNFLEKYNNFKSAYNEFSKKLFTYYNVSVYYEIKSPVSGFHPAKTRLWRPNFFSAPEENNYYLHGAISKILLIMDLMNVTDEIILQSDNKISKEKALKEQYKIIKREIKRIKKYSDKELAEYYKTEKYLKIHENIINMLDTLPEIKEIKDLENLKNYRNEIIAQYNLLK